MSTIPCISLWQPWATALFVDLQPGFPLKPDETRHWPIPDQHLGKRIAIHAAKKDTPDQRAFWSELVGEHRDAFTRAGFPDYMTLPRGAIIGTLVVTACHKTEDRVCQIGSDAYQWGDYGPYRFAWEVAERKLLPSPISFVGKQGFFNVEKTW